MSIAFDNERYLQAQEKFILERVEKSENRLYLEFGGKLLGDSHAARVLPGYDPDVKIRLLEKLRDKADIIVCIHAKDIQQGKRRGDMGITYDKEAMRLIDDLQSRGVHVCAVCITRYAGELAAQEFQQRLEKHGIPVYRHASINGYPEQINLVVSDQGFGANPYIPVTRPLVVITAPGPNSGKMGTCLSQMYHEYKNGTVSHYAKFETFPVWNLPLNHPVNIAYEAATADLKDMNAIDYYHVEAYGVSAVNYNRDLQAFPLLQTVLNKITNGNSWYKSPTDMGVNCIAEGIVDDAACQRAARIEISRRYQQCFTETKLRNSDDSVLKRHLEILAKADVEPDKERKVVEAARNAAVICKEKKSGMNGIFCGAAICLPDGTIVTGKNSRLMHSASSMFLNAVKKLAGIPDQFHLLTPEILESVANFKRNLGSSKHPGLDLSETLIALVISANTNPFAKSAFNVLKQLRHCDVHLTHVPPSGDEAGLRKLGCSYTYEPVLPTKNLFT